MVEGLSQKYGDAAEWMRGKSARFLHELELLVATRSVSEYEDGALLPFGKGCAEVLDRALEIASDRGFETQNHEYYCGSVLYRGSDEQAGEIGMVGHLDIVPEGEGWEYPPFETTVRGDLLIGRGVADNKGPSLAAFYAMYYLKSMDWKPKHSIRLILGCNEENGMLDVKYYNEHFTPPVFAFTPDCAFPVCNTEKGMMIWDLATDVADSNLLDFYSGLAHNVVPNKAIARMSGVTVEQAAAALAGQGLAIKARPYGESGDSVEFEAEGVGAHASMPENSLNAAWRLADALLKTGFADEKAERALRFIAEHFQAFDGSPFGIACQDDISGYLTHIGGMTRITDGKLVQNMNIRYPVTADQEKLSAAICAACEKDGFEAKMLVDNRPNHVPAELPEVVLMQRICAETIGVTDPPYSMGGGTYARKFPKAVGFGAVIGPDQSPFGPERGGVHQPDECASLDMLLRAAAVYAVTLMELDEIVQG